MRIDVRTEIESPAARVFDFIADLTNNPEWQSGVAETTWTSPMPVAVGATCEQRFEDGTTIGYRITGLDPGKSITMETLPGASVAATITRTVQELNATLTRVHMNLNGRVQGWRIVLTPLVRRLVRRSIIADYRRLKRTLEEGNEPPDVD